MIVMRLDKKSISRLKSRSRLDKCTTSKTMLYSINIITNSMKDYAIKYKLCLSHKRGAVSKLVRSYCTEYFFFYSSQ